MKIQNVAKFGLFGLGLTASAASFAQATVPAELSSMIDGASDMALAVIALGITAYAAYRGSLVALTVGKRILSKIGL